MVTLDCEDADSAAGSAAAILDVPRGQLERWLKAFDLEGYVEAHWGDGTPPEDVMGEEIQRSLGVVPRTDWAGTCYFHCTRTLDPNRFARGIEPLTPTLLDRIWDDLFELAKDQVTAEDWARFRRRMVKDDGKPSAQRAHHHAQLYHMKTHDVSTHGGPHGHLVREVAFHARRLGQHNYLDIPEIVEDIGICFESYFQDLPEVNLNDRFRAAAVPCIVKFGARVAHEHALGAALNYVFDALHGDPVSVWSVTGYCTEGQPIPPVDILAITCPTLPHVT